MDKDTRNILRNVVTNCRQLLEDTIAQVLEGQYGVYTTGRVDDVAKMDHLTPDELDVRERIVTHLEHIQSGGFKPADAADQLIREIAFTHLNRLAAYKMMEQRGLIREAVSRGLKSQGFMFYLADHPDDEHLWSTGQQELAYRHFLVWQGAQFADEISVLFSPYDPANFVFPPQRVLDQVLDLINSTELADIWTEDETIGWVYQYFTPKELRDRARKESQAPRNSYELAFRNQFYTPRYVVEFLTDNTLGRTWYEMLQGDTALIEHCQYLVRRPNEIFLAQGEDAPESDIDTSALSQEELLQQPVYIPYRALKDPRRLKVLDPACGSGHFLLYAFDVLAIIYEEAWERDVIDPNSVEPRLREKYATLDDLRCDIPRLILARNLHGIDIDRRATQIAALALWLRAQRYYNDHQIDRKNRPAITQGNIVVAEPMPGDRRLLDEFTTELESPIDQMVKRVFNEMKLAGEAGSLLKIEEAIQDDIARAREEWERRFQREKTPQQMALLPDWIDKKPEQLSLFDVSKITDAEFFDRAERMVLDALEAYAQRAENGHGLRRRLFADDAVGGFAFIELMRQRYDVTLMNPPFGAASKPSKGYIDKTYKDSKQDVYAVFVVRMLHLLASSGMIGTITSRSGLFISSFDKWRENLLSGEGRFQLILDLGSGVLDNAMVETASYIIEKHAHLADIAAIRLIEVEEKEEQLKQIFPNLYDCSRFYVANISELKKLPRMPIAYWVNREIIRLFGVCKSAAEENLIVQRGLFTADDFRFLRLRTELLPEMLRSSRWSTFAKGGENHPFFRPIELVVLSENEFAEIADLVTGRYEYLKGNPNWVLHLENDYGKQGLTYTLRTSSPLAVRTLPKESFFANKGPAIFYDKSLWLALGVLNSRVVNFLINIFMGRAEEGARQYDVQILSQIPWPMYLDDELENKISELSRNATLLSQYSWFSKEAESYYVTPFFPVTFREGLIDTLIDMIDWRKDANEKLVDSVDELDKLVALAYGLDEKTAYEIQSSTDISLNSEISNDPRDELLELVSWLYGAIFGRWDIRYATGERPIPELPDPFDPLPVCPPGMLQNADGLPATETPPGYPLDIDWDGILVDDPDHPDDIVRRMRGVLEVLWGDRAEAIEQEACEILGVKTLRDYFRKPGSGGFWDDHVKRYSKSRRKAPIYWLLQSSRKNYALWLYYHRLDKDLYYKALVNYVQPKLRLEQSRLDALRAQLKEAGVAGREAKRLEREVEQQEALMSELQDFHDALKRVAQLNLVPDLNDGVVLNIAPLHELVPWKEADKYWKRLMDGEYEWSTISQQLRERGMI